MWHFFKGFAWAQKSFEKLKVSVSFLMWAIGSLKLSEAVCLRLHISCGLRHRFEEFEKLKLVWTFQCRLLQLLTNLIELSWEPASFDNKCHLKQLSKRSERACMSSEILWKVEALYELFNVVYCVFEPKQMCDTFSKGLRELRNLLKSWSLVLTF